MEDSYKRLADALLKGGVGIIRTDTLFGLVACIHNQEAVEKVYTLKGRTYTKPCIILVAEQSEIPFDQEIIGQIYSEANGRPTTIVVPAVSQSEWLTRGGGTVAYRVPEKEELRALLRITGPLIAPSANPQGQAPAYDIEEAKQYFGDHIDCYVDEGRVSNDVRASRIIRLYDDGRREDLR
jgi:L-threonylcarbamoyladenylate synthase